VSIRGLKMAGNQENQTEIKLLQAKKRCGDRVVVGGHQLAINQP
jgi:hypothetical protein